MRYRLLGRTGVHVSELSLGTMAYGGTSPFWKNIGDLGQGEVERQIGTAFDCGVNLIDTADYYSDGASETLTGRALAALSRPREDFLLATKCRLRMGAGPNAVGLSRHHVIAAAEASLRRLQLDHIDLYQLHGLDPLTPIDETLRALDHLIRAGKVRYIGLCNFPAWQAMKGLGISERLGLARFETAQMYYSAVGRDIERDIVPLALDQSLSIMAWSPLAGGYLSGKYGADGGHGRRSAFDFPPVEAGAGRKVLKVVERIASRHSVSAARVSLAYLLAKPAVATVIVGAREMSQLKDNLAAADLRLTEREVAAIDAAGVTALPYPDWMVVRQSADRLGDGTPISRLPGKS